MVKKTILLTAVFLMVFSVWAFAGEGTDTVGAGKLVPELRYGYSVSEWKTNSEFSGPLSKWDVSAHDYFLEVNWGVHRNIDLIALVGGRTVRTESEFDILEFKTGYVPMFLWGFGVKGTLYRAPSGFYVGAGLLFTQAFSDDYRYKVYEDGVFVDTSELLYHRYVLKLTPDIHIGYEFANGLTPYVGLDYTWGRSVATGDIPGSGTDIDIEYELDNPLSVYAGLDYTIQDKFHLNAEARSNFTNSWGVGAGLAYAFDINGAAGPAMNPLFLGGSGTGSDTVGVCRLLPQLRYGYSVSDWKTNSEVAEPFTDWDVAAHEYYLQVNWGIHPNVDLIALVGGRTVNAESEFEDVDVKTKSVPMFLWGFGVKGTFYRAPNGFYVGGGLLFTQAFSNDYHYKIYVDGTYVDSSEWPYRRSMVKLTPDIHVGWKFEKIGLTPYIGAEYTWGRSVASEQFPDSMDIDIEYELDNPFAMYLGVDYNLNDKLYFNLEGRSNFADSWGVGAGIGYKFDICGAPAPAPAPAPVIEPKLEPMSKN